MRSEEYSFCLYEAGMLFGKTSAIAHNFCSRFGIYPPTHTSTLSQGRLMVGDQEKMLGEKAQIFISTSCPTTR